MAACRLLVYNRLILGIYSLFPAFFAIFIVVAVPLLWLSRGAVTGAACFSKLKSVICRIPVMTVFMY